MHKNQSCTKHALSYYLDMDSELAILLITKVTHVLTHSFGITNDNSFQFNSFVLGHHTNGNAQVAMILYYLPTRATLEEHIDILPTLNIDTQLLMNLIIMNGKTKSRSIYSPHMLFTSSGDPCISIHYASGLSLLPAF